jgi:hypothetical protein
MQKKSLAVLGTLVLLTPSVALAESPCGVVDDINRHVTTLEHALFSGAVDVMRKAAGDVGVHVPGGIASASKEALILAIHTEEGSLRTLLVSTEAACHAQQVADKAAEDAKRAAEAAKKAAESVKRHICYKKKWPGIKFPYPC